MSQPSHDSMNVTGSPDSPEGQWDGVTLGARPRSAIHLRDGGIESPWGQDLGVLFL